MKCDSARDLTFLHVTLLFCTWPYFTPNFRSTSTQGPLLPTQSVHKTCNRHVGGPQQRLQIPQHSRGKRGRDLQHYQTRFLPGISGDGQVVWRYVACCDVMSRVVTLCRVVWRHVAWCDVMSRGVTSCRVMWRHVRWCDVMSRNVTSCRVVWRHVAWCDVMSRVVTSCRVVWRHVALCDVMSRCVTSCRVMWRHVAWCDVMFNFTWRLLLESNLIAAHSITLRHFTSRDVTLLNTVFSAVR